MSWTTEGIRVDERHGPQLGDEFATADDIHDGDLVCWDRGPEGKWILRRLEGWQLESAQSPVFRFRFVGSPLRFSLEPVM